MVVGGAPLSTERAEDITAVRLLAAVDRLSGAEIPGPLEEQMFSIVAQRTEGAYRLSPAVRLRQADRQGDRLDFHASPNFMRSHGLAMFALLLVRDESYHQPNHVTTIAATTVMEPSSISSRLKRRSRTRPWLRARACQAFHRRSDSKSLSGEIMVPTPHGFGEVATRIGRKLRKAGTSIRRSGGCGESTAPRDSKEGVVLEEAGATAARRVHHVRWT
jgi:hypothetical protein